MPEPTIAERDRELANKHLRLYSANGVEDYWSDLQELAASFATAREEGRRAALREAEAICDAHAEKNGDIHSRVCARNIARLLEPAEEGSER
jgi:hypothetical protein